MKRESLYLQGGLPLNSWYAETEATRNGREQSGLRGTRKVRAGLALHARRPHMGGQAVRYPEGDAKWVKEGIEQIKL